MHINRKLKSEIKVLKPSLMKKSFIKALNKFLFHYSGEDLGLFIEMQ